MPGRAAGFTVHTASMRSSDNERGGDARAKSELGAHTPGTTSGGP